MSVKDIASPAPGQGGADRGAPRLGHHPTTAHGRPAPRPYAALPHDFVGDPRITPLGKVVLAALLIWARGKDHCWPSDTAIGAKVNRSVASVQRALRELEDFDVVIREKTRANRTGRLIWIVWRMRTDARPLPPPVSDPPRAPVTDKGIVIVNGDPAKELRNSAPERRRPEEPPAPLSPSISLLSAIIAPAPTLDPTPTPVSPPAPASMPTPAPMPIPIDLTPPEQARFTALSDRTRERVRELFATGDPILLREARRLLRPLAPPEPSPESIPLSDLLAGLASRPDRVAVAAGRLCRELGDHRSFAYYHSVAASVARREQSAESIVMAFNEGLNPQSKRPGAVFASVWKRETRLQARC